MEKNKIELTGTIHKIFKLKTKAGAPMVKLLLKVQQDTFWVLGYGNIASALMQTVEGDPLAVSGTAQMDNWKTKAGEWKNDFNAVAWTAEVNGQEIRYEKQDTGQQGQVNQQPARPQQAPQPDDRDPGQFDYSGGPF